MDLKGKRIIVTGAATGIGRATALRVAAYGARVAVFDVNDGAGSATVADINEAGGDARYWHVDVAHEAAVSGGVIAAESWLGASTCFSISRGSWKAWRSTWTNFRRTPGHGHRHKPQRVLPDRQARCLVHEEAAPREPSC